MAIYHLSAKIISRGTGRSATAAAAYRAGLDIADERTGEQHDYTRKRGVLDHAVLAPSRAPDWARESATLWNAVEQIEKRKDAQVCREITLALPNELTLGQNRALLHAYVREAFIARGMAAQVDIHAPHRDGDKRNVHAHILLTTRQITRNGFKAKKARNWNEKATLLEWRDQWARHVNRALERAGKTGRIDARSFKDQGVTDRAPSSHLGPAASQMERRGQQTRIGDENRAATAFNELQRKAKVIDLAAERARRRQVVERRAEEAIEHGLKRLSGDYAKAADRQTAQRWQAQAAQKERKAVNDRRPPEDERPLGSHENRRRALLQDRHIGERADLGRRHQIERQQLGAQQRREYARFLLENRRRLSEIEARQKQGGLKGRLYRMSRKAKTEREEAENCRKNIANARWRIKEQREALRNAQQSREKELAQRQQRDVRTLEANLVSAVKERAVAAQSKPCADERRNGDTRSSIPQKKTAPPPRDRQALYAEKEKRIAEIRAEIRERNRPVWAALYRHQEGERKDLEQALEAGGERLHHWLADNQFDRFSGGHNALSGGFEASARRADLIAALEARQEAQRGALAEKVKAEAREAMKAENERYRAKLDPLKEAQGEKSRMAEKPARQGRDKTPPASPSTRDAAAGFERDRDRPTQAERRDAEDEFERRVQRYKARREAERQRGREDPGRERER